MHNLRLLCKKLKEKKGKIKIAIIIKKLKSIKKWKIENKKTTNPSDCRVHIWLDTTINRIFSLQQQHQH